jgi:hypothetical protein
MKIKDRYSPAYLVESNNVFLIVLFWMFFLSLLTGFHLVTFPSKSQITSQYFCFLEFIPIYEVSETFQAKILFLGLRV